MKNGRRKRLTYPDATYITYEYNTKGWLTAIKDGGTNSIVTYDYDAAGRRTKRTLENNTFTVYSRPLRVVFLRRARPTHRRHVQDRQHG